MALGIVDRLVYFCYIAVIAAPLGTLCKECGSTVDDINYNDSEYVSVATIAESYCLRSDCTIVLEESNILLNIINITGDQILVTNATDFRFAIVTNGSNIPDCSSDDTETDDSERMAAWLYATSIVLNFIVLIAAIANITIHFIYKELQTVSGILIIILCVSLSVIECVAIPFLMIRYHQVNIPTGVCAIFFNYLPISVASIYEATKTAILTHFAYIMYRSYRLLSDDPENTRSLLYKYIAFIIGVPAISSIIIIIVDATVSKKAFEATEDRQCFLFTDASATGEIPPSLVIFFVIIIIWLIAQLSLLTTGLVLYFLTTKQCCSRPTTRDLRVAVVLIATVDLAIFIAVLFLVVRVPEGSRTLARLITLINAIKQVTLFILFASSSKVMCLGTKRKYQSNSSTNNIL